MQVSCSPMRQEITHISELINDVCLQLFTIDDESAKQEIIAQLLWRQCIPRTVQLSSQVINRKAMKALWYSLHAVSLHLAPKSIAASSEEKKIAIHALSNMLSFKEIMTAPTLSQLDGICRKYPVEQLSQIADHMFNSAREIILDPHIYSQIPFNDKLARTVFCMCLFLSSRGDREEELQLLISTANVYLKREIGRGSIQLSSTMPSESKSNLLTQLQDLDKLSRILNGIGNGSKQIVALNARICSEKQMKKFLKRFANIYFSDYIPSDTAHVFAVNGNGLKTLHSIAKKGFTDMDTVQKFLNHCEIMISEEPYVSAQKVVPTFLKAATLAIQVCALELVSNKFTETNDLMRLRDAKKRAVNFVNSRIIILEESLFTGNLVLTILNYITKCKIEEVDELIVIDNNSGIEDKNTIRSEICSCLEWLKQYYEICDRLCVHIPALLSLQWRLKSEIEMVENHLSAEVRMDDYVDVTEWFE
jgi:hypothetical protein